MAGSAAVAVTATTASAADIRHTELFTALSQPPESTGGKVADPVRLRNVK